MLEPLRRIPILRHLARAARRSLGGLRTLPRPRYLLNTPDTAGSIPLEAYFPPTLSTITEYASSFEAGELVLDVLGRLTPNEEVVGQDFFMRWGRGKFGRHWRYADITTVLVAAAKLLRPKSYLEIGVRRGRSAAVVGALAPDCAIYGFDLWVEDYGGFENPGPDFVRAELAKAGHRGEETLISGDSAQTVPAFLNEHPDLFFDLITVDGDHSVRGAALDLTNVLPRLKIGGVIVFDDIVSAPWLASVWDWFVGEDARYQSWVYDEAGAGVALAIRAAG